MNRKIQAGTQPETHKLIGCLTDYAERYADMNGEPREGHCREIIRKAEAWLESGSATLDPCDLVSGLVEYVQRYADVNGEPTDGDCRRVLARAAGIVRNLPKIRLWVALVEHQTVPGTQPVLIAQPTEPDDAEIFARFTAETGADELELVGVFDMSHVLEVDPGSRDALDRYVRSLAEGATNEKQVVAKKAPSPFDYFVPWGINRSPLGPSM
ncbi:hypothetical protein P3T23_008778 [Paraburkholderia sp. GAS448]|uniref:hypothetical protein n=1 Tax=Paraburkholderia sp. GAS448 TaxID=3035136 RepID=UPI003D2122A3